MTRSVRTVRSSDHFTSTAVNPYSTAFAVAVQGNGEVVVAGRLDASPARNATGLARDTHGFFDASFGNAGHVVFHALDRNEYANGIGA